MGEIILPDIPMILDISEEYRQDPIYWALYLSIIKVVVTNYSTDAELISQKGIEFDHKTSLRVTVKYDGYERILIADAKEVGSKLYIRINATVCEDHYFVVKENSFFQSLDVLTNESFNNDMKLIELIEETSEDTIKLFEIKTEVEDSQFKRKGKVKVDVKTAKLIKSLLE